MATQAAFHQRRIGRERLPPVRDRADERFPVCAAQPRPGLSGARGDRWQRRGCDRGSQDREQAGQLGGELVQVGLHGAQLPATSEGEREVQAPGMCCFEAGEDGADVLCVAAELGEGQRRLQREGAVEVEPPARVPLQNSTYRL